MDEDEDDLSCVSGGSVSVERRKKGGRSSVKPPKQGRVGRGEQEERRERR